MAVLFYLSEELTRLL